MSKDNNRDLESSMAYIDGIYTIVNRRISAGVKPDYSFNRVFNALSKLKRNLPIVLRKEVQK